MNNYMRMAMEKAKMGSLNGEGGPFGAAIVDSNGKVVSLENNQVIKNNDPTAHAEIQAIRKACENLNTYDLSGCKIYTTCEPCPMCLSAIIWSNIKDIIYGATRKDAAEIGFRDDSIYDYLKGKNSIDLNIKQIDKEECIEIFDNYKKKDGTIY